MQKFIQMNNHNPVLVLDQDEELISKLEGYAIVSYIKDLNEVGRVRDSIKQPSKLHCVVYNDPYISLSSLNFDPNWKGIPICIYISSLGEFCKVSPLIPVIKELNIRIFFYATSPKAIVDAQILSSLGIYGGVLLSENQKFWDELSDLIYYSIYAQVPHTLIEPFGFLCNNYNQEGYLDIKNVYFNSPERYLHINKNEEIALYREDLILNKFIDQGIEKIKTIHQNPKYLEEAVKWQQHFLKEEGCAYCPAWRICKAFFEPSSENGMCKTVFSELLSGIEFFRNQENLKKQNSLCQL